MLNEGHSGPQAVASVETAAASAAEVAAEGLSLLAEGLESTKKQKDKKKKSTDEASQVLELDCSCVRDSSMAKSGGQSLE